MKVLLTDGSGLTARQCATVLGRAGHRVEVVAPDPLCLSRFTRHVARVHRVPPFGQDPFAWLRATLAVYHRAPFDVLLPTQEQVAVLSWAHERLEATGVATAVPSFSSLAAVQDKISAWGTLEALGIPQPPSSTDPQRWEHFPAFVKTPIGTASGGVRKVANRSQLRQVATGEVLIQAAVAGPLVMCQSVFEHGTMVAFHANARTAEGADGGASHKTSLQFPAAAEHLEALGAHLAWHGALSADVIAGDEGPVFIDINPRLVEPLNALVAGVDLVGALVALATGTHLGPQPPSRPGVRTHQLLVALLGEAQHGGGRRGVLGQLVQAARRSGPFRHSHEELTPPAHDIEALVPVVAAAASILAAPGTWRWFTSTAVSSYALGQSGWRQLLATPREGRRGPGLS